MKEPKYTCEYIDEVLENIWALQKMEKSMELIRTNCEDLRFWGSLGWENYDELKLKYDALELKYKELENSI